MSAKIHLFFLITMALILSSCGGQPAVLPPAQSTPLPAPGLSGPDEPVTGVPGGNDEKSKEIPYLPQVGDEKLERRTAAVESVEILTLESFPRQITVRIKGTTPTPCHHPRAEVGKPDVDNRIAIEVYSVVDPSAICAQVLAPFEININLGSYPDGKYTLLVNSKEEGRFEMP